MNLQDFLKGIFRQSAVEGYEIGRLEVDVGILGSEGVDFLVVGEGETPCAKIIIIPSSPSVPS